MTSLTLPIARLRAAGCKVSTIIGHDPQIGNFLYSVTLPKGIPGHYQRTIGQATLQSLPTQRRVIIRSARYRTGQPLPDKAERNAAGVEAARLLESLADHVETYDRASSGSVQHFIETGRYLTHSDAAEASVFGGSYSDAEVIGIRLQPGDHDDTVRVVDIVIDHNGKPHRGGSFSITRDSTVDDLFRAQQAEGPLED